VGTGCQARARALLGCLGRGRGGGSGRARRVESGLGQKRPSRRGEFFFLCFLFLISIFYSYFFLFPFLLNQQ
jgi:hypothetical protein